MDIKIASELNYWVYFGIVELLLILLLYAWYKDILKKFIRYAFGVILVLFLMTNSVALFLLYEAIKKSPLATYLLSGKESFFFSRLIMTAKGIGEILVLAAVLYLFGWWATRSKRPLAEKEFPLTLAISGIITGLSNILPVILLGLFLAIIWQIFQKNKKSRISLIPFLLGAAASVNFLNTFPFWQKFLESLRLM